MFFKCIKEGKLKKIIEMIDQNKKKDYTMSKFIKKSDDEGWNPLAV